MSDSTESSAYNQKIGSLPSGNIQKITDDTDAVRSESGDSPSSLQSDTVQADVWPMPAETEDSGQYVIEDIKIVLQSVEAIKLETTNVENYLRKMQRWGKHGNLTCQNKGYEGMEQHGIQPELTEEQEYAPKKASNDNDDAKDYKDTVSSSDAKDYKGTVSSSDTKDYNYKCTVSASDANANYGTSNRTGLLILLNRKDDKTRKGHAKDTAELKEFFKDTLNFDVKDAYDSADFTFTKKNIDSFLDEVKRHIANGPQKYYCIVFFVGSHGYEQGICTEVADELHTVEDIKGAFSNKEFPPMAGRPKIFLVQVCRGKLIEGNGLEADASPIPSPERRTANYDADSIVVSSTTYGKKSLRHPEDGSILIQACKSTFDQYWKTDHLEEMLLTVRCGISTWSGEHDGKECRQTAEVSSTLTKRLKFAKYDCL